MVASRSHVVSVQRLGEGRDGYEVHRSFGSLGVTDHNWTSTSQDAVGAQGGEGGLGLVSCRMVSCRKEGIWTATFYWQERGRES